jgi:ribonuclease HI/glyoxylase-like metal-dependent hydrolase (beta-lactamase superfamily II)
VGATGVEHVERVERVLIRADGAARGNPGPASAGAVVIDASRPDARDPDAPPVVVIARPLGIATNNVAEYTAVLLGLEAAQRVGASEVELILDSKLVVEQLSGRWKVRHPGLTGLHARIQRMLGGFPRWTIRHEGRASNRAADALANLALDDPATAAALERRAPAATSAARTSDETDRGIAGPAPDGEQAWICRTCGVQYAPSADRPEACRICEDERQYVGWGGQRWTTMSELAAEGHRNVLREEEAGLASIGTEPSIAIGQRALLVRTPHGNVLWDCITYLDRQTVRAVRDLGGLDAIAISHPHFYDAMTEWSAAFDDRPVYIHEADAAWVTYPGPGLTLWQGTTREILPGLTLINTGGHFPGSTVLHWAGGADGRGVLLTGDSLTVVSDRRWVSFMYSYPNLIPLPDDAVRRIVEVLRPFRYQRIYSLFDGRVVATDGNAAVERSAERYLRFR